MTWLPLGFFVAAGVALAAAALYWLDIARARRALCAVVERGASPSPLAHPALHTLRARSMAALGRGFWLVRRGDVIGAELALGGVVREELGAWEQRVLDATRALACLENLDVARAAKLAPLALPTLAPEVDRALARVLVRDAWADATRLVAIGRALAAAGPHLDDSRLVARLREAELLTGELDADQPPEVLSRAAIEAHELGEAAFGDRLLQLAERRGAYR